MSIDMQNNVFHKYLIMNQGSNMRIKAIIGLCILGLGGFVGWRGYHYFFDTTAPECSLTGIEDNHYYAGDVYCILAGHDGYKVADISVLLDGTSLISKYKINSRRFEHPFTVPTKNLPNGRHVLTVEVMNGTYAKKKITQERTFYVDNDPLQAALVRSGNDLKVFQGRTLHVQFQVNKEIQQATAQVLSNNFECFPESKNARIYECFVPISCEEVPNEYIASIDIVDKTGRTCHLDAKFQVIMFPFKKQLLHVSAEKMKIEKELGSSNDQLELELETLAKNSPKEKLWQGTFYPPIEIQAVSTDFGTVRTTQEKGRYVHKAVDVLNAPKSVVWAPQDGVVVVKNRYMHSGNTVVLDHGYGILSLFFHLDDFADITPGKKVKRGNPIGTLGKTGYASGYHLHWEMRINNIQIDPLQWIKPNFMIG